MSDQDKLLSRRQILAIFGAGTGTAIVGSTQADLGSNEQGNLYGGTANMAGLYQVGPGLWKGPLSVRSEVPKEDGHDFIQTDAGDGDQYAMHHYNGGWNLQGLKTKSLETEDSLSKKLPTVDVDAFGAEGDGQTDDSGAIEAAADSLESGTKGILNFSPGKKYRLDNTASIDAHQIVALRGNQAYLVLGGDILGIDYSGNFDATSAVSEASLEYSEEEFGPLISGFRGYSETGTGRFFRFSNLFAPTIQNNTLTTAGTAFEFSNQLRQLSIAGNVAWNMADYGVYFDSSTNVHQLGLNENKMHACRQIIRADDAEVVDFEIGDNNLELSNDRDERVIYLTGDIWGPQITSNNIQDHNNSSQVIVEIAPANGSAETVQIKDNHLQNTVGDAVKLTGINRPKIVDNNLQGIDGTAIVLDDCSSPKVLDNDGTGLGGLVDVTDCQRPRIKGNSTQGSDGYMIELSGSCGSPIIENNDGMDVGAFLYADISESVLAGAITDNTVEFRGDIPEGTAVYLATTGNIRETAIESNTMYATSGDPDGWGYDISCSEMTGVTYKNNKVHTRHAIMDGHRVAASSVSGAWFRDNGGRGISSSETAFDLPAAATDVINDGNLANYS